MHCLAYCLIGTILLGSMLTVMFNKGQDKTFIAALNDDERKIYNDIRRERETLFLQGLGLGAIFAMVYMFFIARKQDKLSNTCILTAIVLGTSYLFYMVRPKKMMLDYLDSPEKVKLYTDLYQRYRYQSSLGMILGVVGFMIFAWGINSYVTY